MPTEPSFIDAPLPCVARLQPRQLAEVTLVVLHCTELPDLATAREYGERVLYPESGTGNSGHFYIDRDGTVQRWVPEDRIAHHVRGHNPHSV
ncbi:MAG TPA: N-acetylmuramoyl-L-alanine amidase, partial [Luteimonas sp.]|nr:N-acetylmuramoyl-L-alanine amidase [Luteimonas sp.]